MCGRRPGTRRADAHEAFLGLATCFIVHRHAPRPREELVLSHTRTSPARAARSGAHSTPQSPSLMLWLLFTQVSGGGVVLVAVMRAPSAHAPEFDQAASAPTAQNQPCALASDTSPAKLSGVRVR